MCKYRRYSIFYGKTRNCFVGIGMLWRLFNKISVDFRYGECYIRTIKSLYLPMQNVKFDV